MAWFKKTKKEASQVEKMAPKMPSSSSKSEVAKKPQAENSTLMTRSSLLNLGVAKVSNSTDMVEATTNQVLEAVHAIGAKMEVQQQTVSKAAAIISELGAFAQQVTASVSDVGNSSRQTTEKIGEGKEAIQSSVDFISEIEQTVTQNAETVKQLVDRTLEVDDFVTTIQDIASQTNLLALNAAIEAARAGEEGRGFAVVANEVKKLADDSAKAASEISKLINTIKDEAEKAVATLRDSVQTVEAGSRLINQTGISLDEVMNSVAATNSLVQEISKAVGQQAANNEQLMSVTESMNQVLEKAAVLVETASFDTEQQVASVKTLKRVSQDLVQLEAKMQESLQDSFATTKTESSRYSFGLPQDPSTLDPMISRDTNSNYVIRALFTGLLQTGEDGKPMPSIASTWHLEEDGKTYTFLLRRNVYFHNGRQVEAKDVKYSLERILKPGSKSPHGGLLVSVVGADEFSQGMACDVKGIKILGQHKISITLKSPNLIFLTNLANGALSIVPQEEVEKYGDDFAKHPVGAGPFVFDHWEPNQEVVIKAHHKYHEGQPYIDEIVYKICAGADDVLKQFTEGNIDHIRLQGDQYDKIKNHPTYGGLLLELPPVDIEYCALMTFKPPFDNKLVRQAANYAFDRQAYLSDVLKGQAVLCQGPLPPAFLDNTHKGYKHNLVKAKQLMKQAGFANGYPGDVKLHVRANNEEQAQRAQAIAEALKAIGIKVTVVTLPWNELRKPENMAKCNMFLMAASGGHAEPTPYLEPWFHSRSIGKGNRVRYSNSKVDELLDRAETLANPERRNELYRQACALITEDAPWMFLFHPIKYMARQEHVKGFKVTSGGEVQLKNLWIDKS